MKTPPELVQALPSELSAAIGRETILPTAAVTHTEVLRACTHNRGTLDVCYAPGSGEKSGHRWRAALGRFCCKTILSAPTGKMDSRSSSKAQYRFKSGCGRIRLFQIPIPQTSVGDFCNKIGPTR